MLPESVVFRHVHNFITSLHLHVIHRVGKQVALQWSYQWTDIATRNRKDI